MWIQSHFIWQILGGISWPGWALHLKTWPNLAICFEWALIDNIDPQTLHILSLTVSCGGYIWKVIWVLHLTSYICHFIWKVLGGISESSSENLSSRTFRCGHQRGLFASRETNNVTNYWSLRHISIRQQMLEQEFNSSKDILVNSYSQDDTALKVVLGMSSSSTGIWR